MASACNGIYKLILLVKNKNLMQKGSISDNFPTVIAIGGQRHQQIDARVTAGLWKNVHAGFRGRSSPKLEDIADQAIAVKQRLLGIGTKT